MKVATTFVAALLSCASAFGMHGVDRAATGLLRPAGLAPKPKGALVQAVDIQGNRLAVPPAASAVVRADPRFAGTRREEESGRAPVLLLGRS